MAAALAALLIAGFVKLYLGLPASEYKDVKATAPVVSGEEKPRSWAEDAEPFNREKEAVAAVLMKADSVEPFRIEPSLAMERGLDGQQILYKAKLLGRNTSVRIATLLLDPRSYVSPGRSDKMCAFQPRLAFRYWKGRRFLDVLICFECDQLMVVERDPTVPFRSLGGLGARFRVGGDFDPIREELKRLMAEAFPGDPNLKEVLDSHNLSSEATESSSGEGTEGPTPPIERTEPAASRPARRSLA
jgi:hypothetical protein